MSFSLRINSQAKSSSRLKTTDPVFSPLEWTSAFSPDLEIGAFIASIHTSPPMPLAILLTAKPVPKTELCPALQNSYHSLPLTTHEWPTAN